MNGVLQNLIQRLQAEPSRERAVPPTRVIGHERRSVEAVQQRMKSEDAAWESTSLADIAAEEFRISVFPEEPFRVVSEEAERPTGDFDEPPRRATATGTRDVDDHQPEPAVGAALPSESSDLQFAAKRANSNRRSDEPIGPSANPAINVAGIVELVRDELRPMLDELSDRLARTVRSEGNSRQFRLRANQIE